MYIRKLLTQNNCEVHVSYKKNIILDVLFIDPFQRFFFWVHKCESCLLSNLPNDKGNNFFRNNNNNTRYYVPYLMYSMFVPIISLYCLLFALLLLCNANHSFQLPSFLCVYCKQTKHSFTHGVYDKMIAKTFSITWCKVHWPYFSFVI